MQNILELNLDEMKRSLACGLLLACHVVQCLQGDYSSRQKRGIPNLGDSTVFVTHVSGDPNVNLSCSIHNTAITLLDGFVTPLNVSNIEKAIFLNGSGNHITEDSCSQTGNESFSFTFDKFGQCASSVEQNMDKLEVNYTLCIVPQGSAGGMISRDSSITIEFSCVYKRDVNITQLEFIPAAQKVQTIAPFSNGSFDITMTRYTSASFDVVETSSTISVPQPLYISLQLAYGDSLQFVLQMVDCWATRSQEADSSPRYNIIISRCASDPASGYNVIYRNENGSIGQFSFSSFLWSQTLAAEQFIFLHCVTSLCPQEDCPDIATCPTSRRRRSAVRGQNTKKISFGPFSIMPDRCYSKEMGCSHGCEIKNGAAVCTCPKGAMTLGRDMKTCSVKEPNLTDAVLGQLSEQLKLMTRAYEILEYCSVAVLVTMLMLSFGMFGLARYTKMKHLTPLGPKHEEI